MTRQIGTSGAVEVPAIGRALAPVPDEGNIYDAARPLSTLDRGIGGALRIDGIARLLQEAGADHLRDNGTLADHPDWITRRTTIDVVRPIVWPARLRIRRWCSAIGPMWNDIRVRIESTDGGLIETECFWVHMNSSTMLPARMTPAYIELMSGTAAPEPLSWRAWLKAPLPAGAGTRFPLRRTDIDHLEHVTNTVYWHAVHEFTAEDRELTAGPHRYVVEYNKPIRHDERLDIHTARTATARTLWFTVAGEARAVAQLHPMPPEIY